MLALITTVIEKHFMHLLCIAQDIMAGEVLTREDVKQGTALGWGLLG